MGPFFMVLRRVDGFAVHAFNVRLHNYASGMHAAVERVDGETRPPYGCVNADITRGHRAPTLRRLAFRK